MPEHVAQHYLELSVSELIADVLRHYKVNVWPQVEALAKAASTDTSSEGIVIEGSALWPDSVVTLDLANVAAIWLTASDAVFKQRIRVASQYKTKSQRARTMVDKFLQRTLVYNAHMMQAIRRHDLVSINVDGACVSELSWTCLSLLGRD